MGDFFLPQVDDFFAEDLCFDNRAEGEGIAEAVRKRMGKSAARGIAKAGI